MFLRHLRCGNLPRARSAHVFEPVAQHVSADKFAFLRAQLLGIDLLQVRGLSRGKEFVRLPALQVVVQTLGSHHSRFAGLLHSAVFGCFAVLPTVFESANGTADAVVINAVGAQRVA